MTEPEVNEKAVVLLTDALLQMIEICGDALAECKRIRQENIGKTIADRRWREIEEQLAGRNGIPDAAERRNALRQKIRARFPHIAEVIR